MLAEIKDLVDRYQDQVTPRSPIGLATTYALNQWDALERFAGDGALPIDNNAVEREMRVVAVGRRNWTFCGSEAGGEWAATLYGLLGTCRLQGVNPHAWLVEVLDRVRDHPADDMASLTPRLWAKARASGDALAPAPAAR